MQREKHKQFKSKKEKITITNCSQTNKSNHKSKKTNKIASKNGTTQPGFLAHFLEGSTFWRAFWRTFGGGSTFWCTLGRFLFPFFSPMPGKKSHFWSLFFDVFFVSTRHQKKKETKSATLDPASEKTLVQSNPTRPLQTTLCVLLVFFCCVFLLFVAFLVALCFACALLVGLCLLFLLSWLLFVLLVLFGFVFVVPCVSVFFSSWLISRNKATSGGHKLRPNS